MRQTFPNNFIANTGKCQLFLKILLLPGKISFPVGHKKAESRMLNSAFLCLIINVLKLINFHILKFKIIF